MADNNCSSIVEALIKGMDTVANTKTVVGEPTHIDDTIILPLVDVSFGVGAGATNNTKESKGTTNGGGGGLAGKISPAAVLVIKNGTTKLINVKNQDAVTKIIDMVPDVIDKISDMVNKKSMPSNEEAVKAAFPEDEE